MEMLKELQRLGGLGMLIFFGGLSLAIITNNLVFLWLMLPGGVLALVNVAYDVRTGFKEKRSLLR